MSKLNYYMENLDEEDRDLNMLISEARRLIARIDDEGDRIEAQDLRNELLYTKDELIKNFKGLLKKIQNRLRENI